MKTIVIFNQKGGVGKTSTAVNLAAELKNTKKKILLIDLDAQCNLSIFCGMREPIQSVCEWLLQTSPFKGVVSETPYGDLIPASDMLNIELLHFASIPAFVIRLRDLLKAIPTDNYDYVLIDCPPTVNQLTAAALVAADYVLIPTEAEFFSADGVGKIAETIEQVKPLNPQIKVLGVLLVKYNSRRVLTRALEEKLINSTRDLLDCDVFNTHIRFTVDIPAAQASGLSAREYKSTSNAATDYANLVNEIISKIKKTQKEK